MKNININESTISHHAICDLHGIKNIENFDNVKELGKVLHDAANKAGMIICGEVYKKFEPVGITYCLLLSTSHFTAHLWIDEKFAHFDIFVCAGEGNAKKAVEYLLQIFKPDMKKSKITYIDRSIYP